MRNRIIEISEQPAKLCVQRRHLIVAMQGNDVRVPIEEIAAVIVAHPQVSYTQAVLAELTNAGGIFVTCDAARMPNGMLLPVNANTLQSERFQTQMAMSRPKQKRIWQQLIRKKIDSQAAVLHEQTGDDRGLRRLMTTVRSGDPQNVEAAAARRYWSSLFGAGFRRDREAMGINACLNYGYAVLRAAVARAICSSGLHPSLGIHHHNRYNAFCLADDLMEPFRPLVDRCVCRLPRSPDEDLLTQENRGRLINVLHTRLNVQGRKVSVFDSLTTLTASLVGVAEGEQAEITLFENWS